MVKWFLFAINLIVGISSYSQADSAQSELKYSFIYDKPNYAWFSAGLTYDIGLNPYNTTLFALGADANIKHEKFNFNFHSRMHFAEGYTDKSLNGKPTTESVYLPERSRDIGFDFSFYFKNDAKKMDQKMMLRHRRQPKLEKLIPAYKSFRWGADIGFSGGVSYYNFGNSILTGVDEDGNQAEIESSKNDASVSTYFTQKIIRLGASRVSTLNFKIKAEKYGTKNWREFSRIYFHGLIGVGQTLDDVLVPFENVQNLQLFDRYELNSNAKMNPIGFAAGYEYFNMKKIGLGYIAEVGIQPGPRYAFGNNFFLNLKLRLHLGTTLG
ncbi:MAG: hypothetical protein ABJG68_00580 [Crocinitomicaceae bacterium]